MGGALTYYCHPSTTSRPSLTSRRRWELKLLLCVHPRPNLITTQKEVHSRVVDAICCTAPLMVVAPLSLSDRFRILWSRNVSGGLGGEAVYSFRKNSL